MQVTPRSEKSRKIHVKYRGHTELTCPHFVAIFLGSPGVRAVDVVAPENPLVIQAGAKSAWESDKNKVDIADIHSDSDR